MRLGYLAVITVASLTNLGARLAAAQPQLVPVDTPKGAEKTDVEQWNPFLGLTSTINLTSNQSVVGQVDGFSTLFGIGVTGGADYINKRHLLRTSLTINESFARTPVVDQFIKTNDVVKLEGLYNYFATKDLGGFGRLAMSSSLFPAVDVRGVSTSWVRKNADGSLTPLATDAFEQRVADAGKPFTINESLGVFANPLRKEKLELLVRFGIGGRHTFANGVLANSDDKATPEIELIKLSTVHQLGAEAFAGASGKSKDKKTSYKAGLSVLFPFVNNDKFDRGAGELTRVGLEGALTFNVYSWMSLVYSLNITRDAQLFPKGEEQTQIQNSLLLTFQFTLVKKREKAKEKTEDEKKLEAEKKRADEAEKRAKEAEEKLKNQPPPTPTPTPTPDPVPAPTPAPDAPPTTP